MTARRSQRILVGLVNREAAPGLLDLVDRYAGPNASDATVAAAVERVRREVPGPFEPVWAGSEGAEGTAEFRRRYPDTAATETVAERLQVERLDRDARQVRDALLGVAW